MTKDIDESDELDEKGKSYLVMKLAEKIIDNANAVSSGIRLLSDNVEYLTAAQIRLEEKYDANKKDMDIFIARLEKSGVFDFLESWSKKKKLFKTVTISLMCSFLFLFVMTAIKMSYAVYMFFSHIAKKGGM